MFVDDTAVNPGFNELGPGLGPELAKSRGLEETQLAARDFVDDNVATVTRSDSEQAMQSRGSLTDFEQLLEGIFRRDDAAGELAELLQSRNWFSDFEDIAASFLRRDGERSEFADDLQSRNWFSDFEEIATSFLRRDVTPDGLNRRYMAGDALDEFIDYFMMNARDLGPELDIEARSIGDSALETMARRDAVDDFIALLKSRDSSTPESLLSLASRALNDLD